MKKQPGWKREDQKYEVNKRPTRPMGVHLIKLEERYIKKQREIQGVPKKDSPIT